MDKYAGAVLWGLAYVVLLSILWSIHMHVHDIHNVINDWNSETSDSIEVRRF
jgi:hypothetical protein